MLYVVIGFLFLSIILYTLLGGADFGAGILELFTLGRARKRTGRIMYESIAPVWEANHMWLIITIVILFVGFPKVYETFSIYLHIPLVLMLLGIIARGTAFTFRHYDAIDDGWRNVYREIFYYSSLVTPFFLGCIAASTISGHIDTSGTDFLSTYIFSWFNVFGISVGIFTIVICAYLASIYSLREVENKTDLSIMLKKTQWMILIVFIAGGLVFLAAYFSGIPLFEWVFSKSLGIIAVVLASLSLFLLLICIKRNYFFPVRALAAFQVIMIMTAAIYQHIPKIVIFKNGDYLSLIDDAAPSHTLSTLAWALMTGSLFILPFLFYLMFSFTNATNKKS